MQINSENEVWPSGDFVDVASLDISDEEIEEYTKLKLIRGVEPGLGKWVAVGGKLKSGLIIELIKYIEAPLFASFILRVDSAQSNKSAHDIILNELGINKRRVMWKRDTW